MMPITPHVYLCSEEGLASLNAFVDSSTLFAFDLDGTLAPIADDPERIEVSAVVKRELICLKEMAPVAIITGRSRRNAQKHLGIVPDYLIGNHGTEGLPGWEDRREGFRRLAGKWDEQLRSMLPDSLFPGILIENKGLTISVHYRMAPDRKAAHAHVLRAVYCLEPKPRRVSGKYVENLLPLASPDKGTALLELMRQDGCRKGFFAGDDVTDEDVFRLNMENLFTVRVGDRMESRARYFLKDQKEMIFLLRQINALLRQMKS